MRYKLNLTLEQNDDLINHLIRSGIDDVGQYVALSNVRSIELLDNEVYSEYEKVFILHFGRAYNIKPRTVPIGTKYYDLISIWFKSKIREYKLEELGI